MFDREYYIRQPLPIEKELNILFRRDSEITIFEIGACEGEDSVRYANLFPQAKIYAFEPLPENVERIKTNIRCYNKSNILVFPYALSDTIGQSTFYVSSGAPEGYENNADWDFGNKSSSLLVPDRHIDLVKFIDFNDQVYVTTDTLDNFCKQEKISSIDFIHMDVQGAELMVLNGAKEMINSIRAIWLEVSKVTLYKDQPLYDDVKKFMSNNNFVLIKDTVDDVTGDQLYISSLFYPNYQLLSGYEISAIEAARKPILTRLIKKVLRKLKLLTL